MGSKDQIFEIQPESIIDPRPVEQWVGVSVEAGIGPFSGSGGVGTRGFYSNDDAFDPTVKVGVPSLSVGYNVITSEVSGNVGPVVGKVGPNGASLGAGFEKYDVFSLKATIDWGRVGTPIGLPDRKEAYTVLGPGRLQYMRPTRIMGEYGYKAESWELELIGGNLYRVVKTYPLVDVSTKALADMGLLVQESDINNRCFPASTQIALPEGRSAPIGEISPGAIVLSFDPTANKGRGELVPRRVTRLFRNATTEWIRLSWMDRGEPQELVCTPGHHFLDQFGQFPPIQDMIEFGRATVVLDSGALAEVTAERIIYSSDTAHLFEPAQIHGAVAGSAALKPMAIDAWQTYNFEVEDLHTYVAGGVRVHNISASWAHERGFADVAAERHALEVAHVPVDYAKSLGRAALGYENEGGRNNGAVGYTSSGRAVSVNREVFDAYVNARGGANASGRARAEAAALGAIANGASRTDAMAIATREAELAGVDTSDPGFHTTISRVIGNAGSSGKGGGGSSNVNGSSSSSGSKSSPSSSTGPKSNWGNFSSSTGGSYGPSPSTNNSDTKKSDSSRGASGKPVLLDISGNGLNIDPLSSSSKFLDLDGNGYQSRTAWAAQGTGVLVIDADDDGKISRSKEFIFTEWDASATGDLEALKHVFDTNGSGRLDAGDAQWSKFRVEINGQLVTLDSLGITSIDLTPKGSGQTFEDGSAITGTTTFTRVDGTTGIVGDATLAHEGAAYLIKTTSVTKADSSVEKTILAYNRDGSLAFRNVVTTSADGKSIQTQFDDDGNGTFDRSQTNVLTVDASGVQTKTVSNFNADGSLKDRTTTVTSADHLTVTTTVDQDGDGIINQRQTYVQSADGSTTTTTEQFSVNGALLTKAMVTSSADGLTKTTSLDRDGNGAYDDIVTETTTIAADGTRSKTTVDSGADNIAFSSVHTLTSGDGRTISVETDSDGNGVAETRTVTISTVAASGDVTLQTSTYNTDASSTLRSTETTVTTANGLSKTVTSDLNGDGVIDLTDTDVTVVDASGNRTQTVQHRSGNNTLLSQTVTTTSADGKSITIAEDDNGDGKNDGLTEIVVGTDGKTTNTSTTLNADTSIAGKTVTSTSADGLSKTTSTDANGDNVNELVVDDVITTEADGSRTETVTSKNANGATIATTITNTSADSLIQTVKTDADGNGVFEETTTDIIVLDGTGKRTETVTSRSADGTLNAQTVTVVSADRQTTTVTTDADGDGKTDTRQVKVIAADGSTTTTETAYTPNDTVTGTTKSIVTVSGNGLTTTTSADLNRDSVVDRVTTDQIVLNADGSKTQTISLVSGNATLLDKKTIVTSGNGKSITTSEDLNGDGVVDTMTTDITTFDTSGLQTQTISDFQGTSLVGTKTITSNLNGLDGSTEYDLDGDGSVNRTSSWKTTPLDPGGSTSKTETVRAADANATLLSQTITTISADQKTTTISSKIDGDAVVDRLETITIGNTGTQTDEIKQYNASGTLGSQSLVTVSDDGLTKTASSDLDGNGVFEFVTSDVAVLNADGSRTQTISKSGTGNALISRTTANVSASGLSKSTSWADATGTVVRSMSDVTVLNADGGTTETLSYRKAGGVLESQTVTTVAAHGLTTTVTIDVDGNASIDKKSVTSKQTDGSTVQTLSDFGANAVLKDSKRVTTSGDGLTQTVEYDSNGDGTVDKKTTSTTVLNANGSKTSTVKDFVGSVTKSITATDVSGDGLTTITKWDTTGTGGGTTFDKSRTDVTVLNVDGSTTQTISNLTGTTLTSRSLVTTSANGLSITTQIDPAGAGSYSQTSTDVTVLNADGTETRTVESKKADGSLISRSITTTSANGLIIASTEERTGFTNQTVTDTTTVLADGAIRETVETKDNTGTLIGKAVTLTSADKLTVTIDRDGNGDGKVDRRKETMIANSGIQTSVTTDFNANGSVKDKSTVVVSADGRLTTTTWDLDGNGTIDRKRVTSLTSNADGSSTTVISDTDLPANKLTAKTTVQTSADGRLTTTSKDTNGDNTFDQVETVTIDSTGASVSVVTNNATARNTSNLTSGVVYWKKAIAAKIETTTSADGRTTIAKYDYDGNGVSETVMQSTLQVDGSVITTVTEAGTVTLKGTIATSADGLITTLSKDTDGNGSIDHTETAVTHADGSITLSKKDANAVKQTVVEEVRSTGTLAYRKTTDLGALNWSYSEDNYDGWGRQVTSNVVYDDNTRLAYIFDATNTNSWWQKQYSYTGTTLVWLREFWDNGTLTHRQYDYNPNNNYWQIANDEYSDGTLIQQTKYFDNGNYDVTRDGVTYHYNSSGKLIGPVLLDLDGDGHVDLRPIDLTNMVASPTFDWDGDGVRDTTAWAGSSDGFLAIDLASDGTAGPDGVIDQAKELAFSLWAEQDGTAGSISDLDGVRLVFDTNHDNVLNADDERWNEFRVWRDANQNGLTDQGELLTVTDAGIKLINLMPATDGSQAFADGSVITGTSSYETLDGSKYLVADASLNYRPTNVA